MDHRTIGGEKLAPPRLRDDLWSAYAGYAVCDPEGKKLGKVEEVFVNEDLDPEYIRVKLGLLGLRSALIPVQFVAVHTDRKSLVLE